MSAGSIPRSVYGAVNPPSPTVDGSVAVASLAVGVSVSGNTAFVASYSPGTLTLVDITDPSVPTVLSTLGGFTNLSVAVPASPYVYLGRNGGLTIIDVSNPNAPTSVGTVTLTAGLDIYDIAVNGHYAFCVGGNGGGNGYFYIVDITNPTAPTIVGSITASSSLDVSHGVIVRDKYAYVSVRGTSNQIRVIDISSPGSPSIVGSLAITGGAGVAALQGRFLYVPGYSSGGNGSFYVVDVSNNPTSPTAIGSIISSSAINGVVQAVAAGNIVYLLRQGGQVVIIDVEDSTTPTIIKTLVSGLGNAQSMALSGRHAVVADYNGNIFMVDLKTAQVPAISVGSLRGDDGYFNGILESRSFKASAINVGLQGILTNGPIAIKSRFLTTQGADVASANDMTLGQGNYFDITGSTQINGIRTLDWPVGSQVTLQFDSTPTVKHNTAASAGYARLFLVGASDFVAAAGNTLTLIYDGTYWRETTRGAVVPNTSGWTDDGTVVRLTTSTDGAGIGITGINAASKLEVLGDSTRKNISILGGDVSSGTSGTITYTTGTATGTATSGSVLISTGQASGGSGNSGGIQLSCGLAGSGATAGSIALYAGSISSGSGTPGTITIQGGGHNIAGGNVILVGGQTTGGSTGGTATLRGGSANATVSSATGGTAVVSGGLVLIEGNGGSVSIIGTDAASGLGGNYNGGSVTVTAGQKVNSGTSGTILFRTGDTTTDRWRMTVLGNFEKQTQGNYILTERRVVANTTDPLVLTHSSSFTIYTNEGASASTAGVEFDLPAAAAGLEYTFIVQDADGLTVYAASGDTIRLSSVVSATGGSAFSDEIGATLTLVAINATEWVGISSTLSWDIT